MRAGTYGYTALSSATPLPIALAIVTRPARAAFTTPGMPEHAVGAQVDRVEEVVVDAPVDDVHGLRARRRAHPDGVVAAVEVATLDELDAHVPGQEGVLVVGGVVHAGSEHDDGRVPDVRRGRGPQRVEEPLGVLVHRPHAVVGEHLGEHVRQGAAVLEHVRDAGRVAQVVLEDAELARLVADEVDAGDVDAHVVGGLDAPRLTVEVGGRRDEAARDEAVREHLAGAVDVGQEGLERVQPLDDAGLDVLSTRSTSAAVGPGPSAAAARARRG